MSTFYTNLADGPVSNDEEGPTYTGQDVIYREKGVSALDGQRAADTLLRLGQKPSIAALREQLGGGSPNTLGPLLEKYWKSLGTRIPAGPESLERVPESLARMTEALWLRSIDEARERTKVSILSKSPLQQALTVMESKVTELTAALAESCARGSEMEAQLLTSLRERLELREQVRQLTAMLKAEQELRAQDREKTDAQGRELQERRSEMRDLARRRLATRKRRKTAIAQAKTAKKKVVQRLKKKALAVSIGKRRKKGRTRLVRQGHR
jgi:hypothetical protein